jgi:tripartite-type tricarboxylate transporter receptor subunit TctC
VNRWNSEIGRALAAPDLRDRLNTSGIEPRPMAPEQFAGFIKSEAVRYAQVIKDAGIKPQ